MKAVQISTLDGPGAVEFVDLDEPVAAVDEIVIDVKAVGVSFVDALMTRGKYQVRPELPFVPGVEVAGLVRSAPDGASVKAGDRCAAYIPRGGGYAEVVVPSLSDISAAGRIVVPSGCGVRDELPNRALRAGSAGGTCEGGGGARAGARSGRRCGHRGIQVAKGWERR